MFNLNYHILNENVAINKENVAIGPDLVAIQVAIEGMKASRGTIEKVKAVFQRMGMDGVFGRSDIVNITGESGTAAGNLINKMKECGLVETLAEFGKGKYRFVWK